MRTIAASSPRGRNFDSRYPSGSRASTRLASLMLALTPCSVPRRSSIICASSSSEQLKASGSTAFPALCFLSTLRPSLPRCLLPTSSSSPASRLALRRQTAKGLKRYYESPHAEAYKKYRASTSILLLFVGYSHVPLGLKRTIFLDLERYEYTPTKGQE